MIIQGYDTESLFTENREALYNTDTEQTEECRYKKRVILRRIEIAMLCGYRVRAELMQYQTPPTPGEYNPLTLGISPKLH